MSNTLKLIISIALPLIIGFTASLFTTPEISGWFTTLQKPSWNPPNWLFAPVWTILYILMGIAFYIIWKWEGNKNSKQLAITFFIIQLLLNFCWSFIFFNQHQVMFAFIEIIILWTFILLTIISFAKRNKLAAWLLVPYISWVSFAAILNFTIWKLN